MRLSILSAIAGIIFLTPALSSTGLTKELAPERQKLELRIFGVCPICESDIKSRVLGIPGVIEVNFNIVRKNLFITFDPEFVNETKIMIALRQGGYEVRRPFKEWKLDSVALEISGIRDQIDVTEIERTLYAFYDVDRVEISKHSDYLITVIDFKKESLDPGQFIMSLKSISPKLGVELLSSRETLKAEVNRDRQY
jgi:copper chaperone CopZ